MMKKFNVNALLIGLCLLVTTPMFSQRGEGRLDNGERSKWSQHQRRDMLAQLDLTGEQSEKIKELRLANFKQTQPLDNELGEKRADLKTLINTEQVDRKAVENLVQEMGDLRTELAVIRELHRLDVREVLTEEQRMKMSKGRDKMVRHRRHGKR